jgi:hypothetical protein
VIMRISRSLNRSDSEPLGIARFSQDVTSPSR